MEESGVASNMDQKKTVDTEKPTSHPASTLHPSHSARKHVDFTTAQRTSQQAQASRRARKRGRVCHVGIGVVYYVCFMTHASVVSPYRSSSH